MIIIPKLSMQVFRAAADGACSIASAVADEPLRTASVVIDDGWLRYRFVDPPDLGTEDVVRFSYVCDDMSLLRADVLNYLDSLNAALAAAGKEFYQFVVDEPPRAHDVPREGGQLAEQCEVAVVQSDRISSHADIEMTTELADQEDTNTQTDRYYGDESTAKREEELLVSASRKEEDGTPCDEEEEEAEDA